MDNKSFINQLGKRLDCSPKEITRLVEALAATITHAASEVDSVAIPGFGTFQAAKEDESIIVSPDGRRMLMPPAVRLSFKESVVLRKKFK